MSLIKCPFCGEDDFDQVGLKLHLFRWCEAWGAADDDDTWARSKWAESDPAEQSS